MARKFNGKTPREWLIIFAKTNARQRGITAHIALEEAYAEGRRAPEGSLSHFAAGAYEGISQNQLERLISAVEKK